MEIKTKKSKKKQSELNRTAQELIRMAEEGGVEQNFFFTTTFERYKIQLNTLDRLQQEIDQNELMVEREYIKGKAHRVPNPAIQEYNKTATAANQTVRELINIIKTFAAGPIMSPSNGADDIDL